MVALTRRHSLAVAALVASVLVALSTTPAMAAVVSALAQDTQDRTGLFGPVIDHYWPVIVTFLTSLTLKVVAQFNAGVAKLPEPAKWGILYGIALAQRPALHDLHGRDGHGRPDLQVRRSPSPEDC